jgi:hypothetical protein
MNPPGDKLAFQQTSVAGEDAIYGSNSDARKPNRVLLVLQLFADCGNGKVKPRADLILSWRDKMSRTPNSSNPGGVIWGKRGRGRK